MTTSTTTKRQLERALTRERQLRTKCQTAIREHTRSQRELGRAMMTAERELARIARAPKAKAKAGKAQSRAKSRKR
jgi:hypothetical protein